MTDPLGRYWAQPKLSDIIIDDTHAVMTKNSFEKLSDYSHSLPTAAYEGKMWRSLHKDDWYLLWFRQPIEWRNENKDFLYIEKRQILIIS